MKGKGNVVENSFTGRVRVSRSVSSRVPDSGWWWLWRCWSVVEAVGT